MTDSLAVVVGLINTSPRAADEEGLPSVDALGDFVAAHRISGVTELTERDLTSVRALRDAFHQVFTEPGRAIERLNEILSGARTTPRISEHDGYAPHIHYFAPGASITEHLAADCGIALAQVVVMGEAGRLRVCTAPHCSAVYVDESRNRSRVYCDSSCGNRVHVAAYRARSKAVENA
ncbi:CGNR zinc finger domain-containing protein [Rhizohabitans arisaemae]|uniref:CGNR zinc finger domain-containing protein n=1 Tax=Rhizohabitans arisaemae TaxID=2720610 RepID=UPI0024B1FA7C|nr:CGNR zinc finger domain-containing protein [Rhizohabitans arisaemae]